MRGRRGVGLAVFCLLAGSRWWVEDAWPSALPGLWGQAVHFAVIGVVALAVGRSWPRKWARIAMAGVTLLGVPAILSAMAGSVVDRAGAALFTLVPLFVVVGAAAVGAEGGGRALMVPALVGAAGGLLVLPFELPSTGYGAALFGVVVGAVLVTAGGGIWLHEALRGVGVLEAAAVVGLANALLLVAAAVVGEGVPAAGGMGREGLQGVVLELPMMLLLLWLVREVKPVRLAARAFFVPLVTVVEGVLLLRPGVDWRLGVGVGLLVMGGGALLWWEPVEGETGLGLG